MRYDDFCVYIFVLIKVDSLYIKAMRWIAITIDVSHQNAK